MGEESKKNIYRSIKDESLSTSLLTGGLDKHLTAGYYQVEINHTRAGEMGLPAGVCNGEHYVKAHLLVTESGTDKALQKNRKVGQVLFLTGCAGNVTQIYTRCGSCTSAGTLWGSWSSVPIAAADALPIEVEWNAHSSIDSFVEAGTYIINGERLSTADGLPIANSSPGHTIAARLLVLNSSISGTGDSQDKCVTQILTLSNRTGGDGDVYIRTGSSSSINRLVGGSGWEQWGKLQQNIEVGQVSSLDSYILNGMYSGVYTNGSTFFETFVMVVINNYAVAGETGKVRSVSQFKYALNVDGTFSYKTRTGQGNSGIAWGNWVDLGAAATADIQDGAITAQKLSSDVREKVNNPLRPLFIAAGAEYNNTESDITKTAPWGETVTHKAGYYYLNGLGDITEEQMMEIYNAPHNALYEQAYANVRNVPTFLFSGNSSTSGLTSSPNGIFMGSKDLKVIAGNGVLYFAPSCGTVKNLFRGCNNLKHICLSNFYGRYVKFEDSVFQGCVSLVTIKITQLEQGLSFADSPQISKESILFTINNAIPKSAITITLHADAYTRLADDAEIVAALEAQPLISLVSA